jgi:hypothetical protein
MSLDYVNMFWSMLTYLGTLLPCLVILLLLFSEPLIVHMEAFSTILETFTMPMGLLTCHMSLLTRLVSLLTYLRNLVTCVGPCYHTLIVSCRVNSMSR